MTAADLSSYAPSAVLAKTTYPAFDWPLFASLFLIVLLSGAVQYFDIFMLAGINLMLSMLLLVRIRGRLSKRLAPVGLFCILYFVYGVILQLNAGEVHYIIFRFYDIFSAVLFLNYIIIRGITLDRLFSVLFAVLLFHGLLNWLVVTNFFYLFSANDTIKSMRWLIFFGMDETYLGIHRSQGLFWEPGVYQIYLNVGLHYFLFYRRNVTLSALSIVGIGLTLSTTGLLIASVQVMFGAFALTRNPLKRLIVSTLIIATFFVFAFDFVFQITADKLQGSHSGSFMARNFDTLNGIGVTITNPFGIGFSPWAYQEIARANPFNIDTPLITDRGQTNGLLIMAYSTGWAWAVFFVIALFRQKVFPQRRILFFFVYAFSLSTSPLFFAPFTFILVLSSLVQGHSFLTGVPLHDRKR